MLKLNGDVIQVGEGVRNEEVVFKWVLPPVYLSTFSDQSPFRDGSRFYGNWNHDSGSPEGRGQVSHEDSMSIILYLSNIPGGS